MDPSISQGLLVACIPLGAIFGCFVAKCCVIKLSRRHCIFIGNSLAICFGFLKYIPNFFVLIFMRIGQGVALGIISTMAPILLQQMCPKQQLQRYGFLTQFFISFGIFFTLLLQFILVNVVSNPRSLFVWIIVSGYPIILLLFQSILLKCVYDLQSPKSYLSRNDFTMAKRVISQIYKAQYVQEVFLQNLRDNGFSTDQPNDVTIGGLNSTTNNSVVRKNEIHCSKKAIFSAYHLGVLQQFAGVGAVVVFGVQVTTKVYPSIKQLFPTLLNLQTTLLCFLLPVLLKRHGRKSILQLGCLISIISTLLIGIGFSILSRNSSLGSILVLIGMIIFMGNFGMTIGGVSFILISQIVEPKYVSYSVGWIWVASFIVMFLFPIITGKLLNDNPSLLFYFFTVWTLMSLFINHFVVIQTKGKTQHQIRAQYLPDSDRNKSSQVEKKDEIIIQ